MNFQEKAKQPNAPLHLTYGVELEFVFAFHQNQLKLTRNGVLTTIVKNIPYLDREWNDPSPATIFTRIDPREAPGRTYNS
jgi:hypothetical protein